MAEHSLRSDSALGGYSATYGDTRVQEISNIQVVSIAVPRNGLSDLNKTLQELWSVSFPEAGKCLRLDEVAMETRSVTASLLGLQADQCLAVFENRDTSDDLLLQHSAMNYLQTRLDNSAYLTEQSDGLAVLEIQGSLTEATLERICMLDISRFNSSSVARTLMEHLSVIIEFPAENHARLYSPRSMSGDFLHAIETSLVHVAP
jgi:sarcosine oxidase subunit gamma